MKLLRLVRGMAQSVYDSYQQAALFEDAFGKSGGALAAALAVNKLWLDLSTRVRKALPHLAEVDNDALTPSIIAAINRGHTLEVERGETATKLAALQRELRESQGLAEERLRVLKQLHAIVERPFPSSTRPPSPRFDELRGVLQQLAQFTVPTPPDDAA